MRPTLTDKRKEQGGARLEKVLVTAHSCERKENVSCNSDGCDLMNKQRIDTDQT